MGQANQKGNKRIGRVYPGAGYRLLRKGKLFVSGIIGLILMKIESYSLFIGGDEWDQSTEHIKTIIARSGMDSPSFVPSPPENKP